MKIKGWLTPGICRWAVLRNLRQARVPAHILIISILAVPLLAAPQTIAATEAPVAQIGSELVSGDDYVAYLRGYLRSKLFHGGSNERVRELADEALENLIVDRLLTQEVRRRGIEGNRAEVEERLDKIEAAYSERENWPEIEARLPEIAEEILIDTQIEALKEEISKVAAPDEASLRAFYAERPDLFTEPPSWELGLILFGLPPSTLNAEWEETGAKAAAVFSAIQSGQSFAELAAQHSTHDSAQSGGILGRVHSGQLPDEAERVVEQLAIGEVSQPIRLLEGYAILRLDSRTEAKLQPFEAVRDRALVLYSRERAAEQWSEFLESLRAQTPVEVFDVSAHVQKMLAGE